MNEQDLDSAARELNQLTGPAKELLHDWLDGARRKLEAQQALEVSLLDSNSQWVSLTVLRTCKRERRRLDSWMVPIHRCNPDDLPMYFIAPCYFRSSQTLLYHQDRQPRVTCTLRLTVHQSQDVDMTLRASMRQVIQETITVTLSHPFEGCLRTELSCGYNRLQNSLCTISFCPIRMQPEGCQLLLPVKSPPLTLALGGRLSPRVKNSTAKLSWGQRHFGLHTGVTWSGSGVSAYMMAVPWGGDRRHFPLSIDDLEHHGGTIPQNGGLARGSYGSRP